MSLVWVVARDASAVLLVLNESPEVDPYALVRGIRRGSTAAGWLAGWPLGGGLMRFISGCWLVVG